MFNNLNAFTSISEEIFNTYIFYHVVIVLFLHIISQLLHRMTDDLHDYFEIYK